MIDINKRYRTRDGREVRIYAVDGGGGMPVHGAVLARSGEWLTERWSAGGEWSPQDCAATPYDLIEVKPRIHREVWVNVYPDKMGAPNVNKAYVDRHREEDCIACVKLVIDCEEGEGL